jgi:hypothetical protein
VTNVIPLPLEDEKLAGVATPERAVAWRATQSWTQWHLVAADRTKTRCGLVIPDATGVVVEYRDLPDVNGCRHCIGALALAYLHRAEA